ncbi:hypothetical protein N9985_01735 [Gammaproteobacteria bacterium]|nr:hypothetical protein [Gammaproteobacteria bacterium]
MSLLSWLTRLYTIAGSTFLTIMLLLVLTSAGFYLLEKLSGPDLGRINPKVHDRIVTRKRSDLSTVYPQYTNDEIDALLVETWSRPVGYEAFTQFRERPFNGRYINVSQKGFRYIEKQAAWPPRESNFNIFVFGGSTTFGYGVADTETIPSQLQKELRKQLPNRRIAVYNFGRSYYYSTQERVLYEQLLADGHRPSLALFIDGINEYHNERNLPGLTRQLTRYVDSMTPEKTIRRLIADLNGDMATLVAGFVEDNPLLKKWKSREQLVDAVNGTYLANSELITTASKANGVEPIFVWQPSPTYRYDQDYNLFKMDNENVVRNTLAGFDLMRPNFTTATTHNNRLWLADIQKEIKRPLYVDGVHYSADMSHMIATAIATWIVDKKLIK